MAVTSWNFYGTMLYCDITGASSVQVTNSTTSISWATLFPTVKIRIDNSDANGKYLGLGCQPFAGVTGGWARTGYMGLVVDGTTAFYVGAHTNAKIASSTYGSAVWLGDTINPSYIFSAGNRTSRTATVYLKSNPDNRDYLQFSASPVITTGEGTYLWDATGIKTLATATLTLNAPPVMHDELTSSSRNGIFWTEDSAGVQNSRIKGCNVTFGGRVDSYELVLGEYTLSGSLPDYGDLYAPLVGIPAGTYDTPTLTVTDSRGQSTTKVFPPITITQYVRSTYDITQVQSDTGAFIVNRSTVSVTVDNISVPSGYVLEYINFNLGSTRVRKDLDGTETSITITMPLTELGTFTPELYISDSRGLGEHNYLDPITVVAYTPPTVSNISVKRITSLQEPVENDEGTDMMMSATFSFLNGCSILEPSVTVNGVATSVTWYTDSSLTTLVDWTTFSPTSPFTIYAYSSGYATAYSYRIGITPEDNVSQGTEITVTLPQAFLTIDYLAGGHGVSFGAPINTAELFASVGGSSAPTFEVDKYYETVTTNDVTTYVILASEPSDWATNWTDYYVKMHDSLFKCNMDAEFVDANNVMRALFDFVYPVGSYYETSDISFNPNDTWGGRWQLETEGLVHISAGINYPVSGAPTDTKDGGSKDAIIPYHNHSVSAVANAITGGAHTHSLDGNASTMAKGTNYVRPRSAGAAAANQYITSSTTHTHNLPAHNTNYAGTSGNAIDANMQPYIAVNRWHRIA